MRPTTHCKDCRYWFFCQTWDEVFWSQIFCVLPKTSQRFFGGWGGWYDAPSSARTGLGERELQRAKMLCICWTLRWYINSRALDRIVNSQVPSVGLGTMANSDVVRIFRKIRKLGLDNHGKGMNFLTNLERIYNTLWLVLPGIDCLESGIF